MKGIILSKMYKRKLIAGIAVLLMVIPFVYAQSCFETLSCNNNQKCQLRTCYDIGTGSKVSEDFVSCSSCGAQTDICEDGSIVTCENTCTQGTLEGASCVVCNPQELCTPGKPKKPTLPLPFAVFEKKELVISISPEKFDTPDPVPVTYTVDIQNPNPVDIILAIDVSVPTDWEVQFNPQLTLLQQQAAQYTFTVNPSPSSSEGRYEISAGFFNPQYSIVGLVTTEYNILPHNTPTLSITPLETSGTPGESMTYDISITNNDPATFEPSVFELGYKAPEGWEMAFSEDIFLINSGESATSLLTVVPNATPDVGPNRVEIALLFRGNFSTSIVLTHTISLCGDHVCQPDEETACTQDCPVSAFSCPGRCERETDIGVDFRAGVMVSHTNFLVCNRNTTYEQCLQTFAINDCGPGNSCLCGSIKDTECSVRCVDTAGVYYLAAASVGSVEVSANYSYSCPFVDLPALRKDRDDLFKALDDTERAKAAFAEALANTRNLSEKAKLQPCYDAQTRVAENLTEFVSYLDEVLDNPAKSNTTEARSRIPGIKRFILSMFNLYCRDKGGILSIDFVKSPSNTEIGKQATSEIIVKNLGKISYYGSIECNTVNPNGTRATARSACTQYSGNAEKISVVQTNVTEEGMWGIQCRIIGSLDSDCKGSVHDETETKKFKAFSKEVYIQDITIDFDQTAAFCKVRTNRDASCVACSMGAVACPQFSQSEEQTTFRCPLTIGNNTFTGFVFPTSECIVTEPSSKTAILAVPGCGDGLVSTSEQCDPQSSKEQCKQTSFTCEGRRYGIRSSLGTCNSLCVCVTDEFEFACVKNRCNAECSTGETKNQTREIEGNTFVCIQTCTESCTFEECYAYYAFTFSPVSASGSTTAGDSITYKATIKNIGNFTDTYEFSVQDATIAIRNQFMNSVTLRPKEAAKVIIKFRPQSTEEGEVEAMTISIKSVKTGATRNFDYNTVIVATAAPTATASPTLFDEPNTPPEIINVTHMPKEVLSGNNVMLIAEIQDDDDAITDILACKDKACSAEYCRLNKKNDKYQCAYQTNETGQNPYYIFAQDERGASVISDENTFLVKKFDPTVITTEDIKPDVYVKEESTETGMLPLIIIIIIIVIVAVILVKFRDYIPFLNRFGEEEL